jgi:hypothetical protein
MCGTVHFPLFLAVKNDAHHPQPKTAAATGMPTPDQGAHSFTLELIQWACGDQSTSAIRNWACVHFR